MLEQQLNLNGSVQVETKKRLITAMSTEVMDLYMKTHGFTTPEETYSDFKK
jgi:hypothetical protein